MMRTRSGRGELEPEVVQNSGTDDPPVLKVVNKRPVVAALSSQNKWPEIRRTPKFQRTSMYRRIWSFSISYDANHSNPHWCMEATGPTSISFLSCIDTVKLFTENYPEIRQLRCEGSRFIFETSIPVKEDQGPPENLRTRLEQFCINASHVSRIDCAPKVNQILWTR